MRYLVISLLLSSVVCFGQTAKKDIANAARPISIGVIGSDTSYSIIMETPVPFQSYGQEYDVYPQYIGGDSAEVHFVNKNMRYPECIRCKGTSDYTELIITINEDGSISNASVEKKFPDCEKCDEEAVRIAKLMPKWKPAQLNGKNIKIKWDFAVRFNFSK